MNAKELLETIKMLGSTDRVPVMVRLPKDLHARARAVCQGLGLTWNQMLAIGLLCALETLEKKDQGQD